MPVYITVCCTIIDVRHATVTMRPRVHSVMTRQDNVGVGAVSRGECVTDVHQASGTTRTVDVCRAAATLSTHWVSGVTHKRASASVYQV